MAYQLQAGLTQIDTRALPGNCASDGFVVYPQPSVLNYVSQIRPSTMDYGTSPYMAGKGAPNHLIPLDDALRPQSTSRFNKILVETYARDFFPLQDVSRAGQAPTLSFDPASSRADVQNLLFTRRYCSK
jgi:hypothetical protein